MTRGTARRSRRQPGEAEQNPTRPLNRRRRCFSFRRAQWNGTSLSRSFDGAGRLPCEGGDLPPGSRRVNVAWRVKKRPQPVIVCPAVHADAPRTHLAPTQWTNEMAWHTPEEASVALSSRPLPMSRVTNQKGIYFVALLVYSGPPHQTGVRAHSFLGVPPHLSTGFAVCRFHLLPHLFAHTRLYFIRVHS